MLRPHRLGLAALALVAALLGSGCSDSSGPGAIPWKILAPVQTAPVADSPAGVLRLVEWCWDHLDVAQYRTVFTDNFRYVPLVDSTSGNPAPFTREDEIGFLTYLRAHAQSVSLQFDRNLRVENDPRPGMVAPWHRFIRTSFTADAVVDGQPYHSTGYADFFVARGDSAVIPLELEERGVQPDSTRWYVQGWEEDTPAIPFRATRGSLATH